MRRRVREQARRFVAEGEDLLQAADAAGWTALERYAVAGSGLPGVEVEPKLLASASGLASGTRTLAVYEERWTPKPSGPVCVYLHRVHDPGNVGAILRSAEAFGASCVAIGPGTADPFGPKAVRASMGAVFGVALASVTELDALPGQKIALVPDAALTLIEAMTHDRTELTLLVGSERDGLPVEITRRADTAARIPIRTHSLNAAMAATVGLYEVTRMARA
jgi:RNA methyltransferase, TrmH family